MTRFLSDDERKAHEQWKLDIRRRPSPGDRVRAQEIREDRDCLLYAEGRDLSGGLVLRIGVFSTLEQATEACKTAMDDPAFGIHTCLLIQMAVDRYTMGPEGVQRMAMMIRWPDSATPSTAVSNLPAGRGGRAPHAASDEKDNTP